MALNSKHPDYDACAADWLQMRDTYAGQRAVKAAGRTYLPATSSQLIDWHKQIPGFTVGKGEAAYLSYVDRSVFPEYVSEAVRALVGTMHHKPPVITLPAALEPLREAATLSGESLESLLRRINEAQFVTGRIGLMLDLPASKTIGAVLPYVATYTAESVINWDAGASDEPSLNTLNLVVLDESGQRRGVDFEWEEAKVYRVLLLGSLDENETVAVYRQGVFEGEDAQFVEDQTEPPVLRGRALDRIPFVFVNAVDLAVEPGMPPLLPLSNLSLTIYRGEADYRQSLFMQGQDTFITSGYEGDSDDIRIGSGAHVALPMGGTAEFVGVSSGGVPEQRAALENDHTRAQQRAGQLIDSTSREKESGEALHIRVAAQTTTLNRVALAGAAGLQAILRIAAEWVGANPAEVIVEANLDFSDTGLTPTDLFQLQQAREAGLPMSDETLHGHLVENEWTTLKYAEEIARMATEAEARRAREPEPPPMPAASPPPQPAAME